MRMELDGEDFEQVEHFPSQKHDGNQDHEDGYGFSEIQPVAGRRLKTPGYQSQNIKGGETENQDPQNAVYVALLVQIFDQND
jgi:hypothetical protein